MRPLCFLVCCLVLPFCKAQDVATYDFSSTYKRPHLGLGFGLDQGGIGLRMDVPVMEHLALFAGVGHALVGAGWNGGLIIRALPDMRFCPYATVMYGYNAAIMVQGAPRFNQIYHGPSLGFGVEMRRRKGPGYWHLALLIPDRSSTFTDDFEELDAMPEIEMGAMPPPVLVSIGYHFAL